MYCTCTTKYIGIRSAGGVDFRVCVKSKGGCGKEVVDFESKDDMISFKPVTKLDEQTCPECYGAGRLYNVDAYSPYGDECETCQGYGKVK